MSGAADRDRNIRHAIAGLAKRIFRPVDVEIAPLLVLRPLISATKMVARALLQVPQGKTRLGRYHCEIDVALHLELQCVQPPESWQTVLAVGRQGGWALGEPRAPW